MKRLFSILSIAGLCSLLLSQEIKAQDNPNPQTVRDRIASKQNQQQKSSSTSLSVRAENMNADQKQEIGDAPWVREIYRKLDLNKDKNAALYFPESPIGNRMNLFTMAFKLIVNGDVIAYEYLQDGRELFTNEYALKVKNFLDNQGIMYKVENGKYIVEDFDIPGNEVQGYYLKEAWYFDKTNSVVDIKILAICPILYRQDDFGIDSTPYPLFWLPYESIRPYALRMPIMTSNLNNAQNQTIDDYFRKRSYDGEIYKTTNMRNLTLAQYCPTDSLMKKEQRKIESQLVQFEKNLWVTNDTTAQTKVVASAANAKTAKAKEETKASTTKRGQAKQNKVKVEKPKSSAPAKSMRSRRSK
ncbi:MAG: gliding motility protein GldN [Dysgonomonas sp.]